MDLIENKKLPVSDIPKGMIDAILELEIASRDLLMVVSDIELSEEEPSCFDNLKQCVPCCNEISESQWLAQVMCIFCILQYSFERELCTVRFLRMNGGVPSVSAASIVAWIFFILDNGLDYNYYATTAKQSDVLKYGMLVSLIAPHVMNVITGTRIFLR